MSSKDLRGRVEEVGEMEMEMGKKWGEMGRFGSGRVEAPHPFGKQVGQVVR